MLSATAEASNAKGAIACGHPETATAAKIVLEAGGNAFDAVLAGFCAATVAEPVFCSLGGGGFLLAQPAEGEARLYDFFVQTPKVKVPETDLDFYPAYADFGTVTQEFHIGIGSIATPGAIKGFFAIHDDLGTLPLKEIMAPAIATARQGFALREPDSFVLNVVGPIMTARADSRGTYSDDQGQILAPGAILRQENLAQTLEALAEDGEGLFYDGPLGEHLLQVCREQGGQLQAADLADYRVLRRRPLRRRYHAAEILTNPPPSSGGLLIGFALGLLEDYALSALSFGSKAYAETLASVMALTNQARVETAFHGRLHDPEEGAAERLLLDPELLARYGAEVLGCPKNNRGTTHLSVIDRAGNMAAMTLSNGEGCGYVLKDSGIMMNNMLGEEDINPAGFHSWTEDTRISSMMSPSLAFLPDGRSVALGSGGSNRIRTAILQVLLQLIDFGQPVAQAVTAPRLHWERGRTNIEAGFAEEAKAHFETTCADFKHWPEPNLFFGGVHSVSCDRTGHMEAAGDPRRGGVALTA